MNKKICLLGSTGSVGRQCLDVCERLNFKVLGVVCNENIELLEEQVRRFNVKVACVRNEKFYKELKEKLKDTSCEVVSGDEGILKVCMLQCDLVLNAIVGVAGLMPTIFALENKKNVALANKETLVTGGELVMNLAQKNGCKILPVDSEHSAIFQSIQGVSEKEIEKIILTASGGPFFRKTRKELEKVTVADALKHPNWSMGPKITVDCATMMNKGLELIEAVHLFKKDVGDVEIIIHPESVLHSAVRFVDHALIGQFSVPDMRLAIQYALTYPLRLASDIKNFSFTDYLNLRFFKPDFKKFPCLNFAIEAMKKGGLYPTILNAANEVAVDLFLKGKIKFLDIEKAIEKSLEIKHNNDELTIQSILKTDIFVKEYILRFLMQDVE